MASEPRKAWREFKKKHPEFEKNKAFKSDIGPQLDKAWAALMTWRAKEVEAGRALAEAMKNLNGVGAGFDAYRHFVDAGAMARDFDATEKTIMGFAMGVGECDVVRKKYEVDVNKALK